MQIYIVQRESGGGLADEWVKLGCEAYSRADLTDAEGKFREALRIDPRCWQALMDLAVTYARMPGRINDALLAIERAELIDPNLWQIHANRCLMALDADRIDEALAAGRRAVELAPKTKDGNHGRWALGLCCATAGVPGDAIPIYKEILAIDPTHFGAALNLCFVQTLTDCGPAEMAEARRVWWAINHYKGEKAPHDPDLREYRPLRVGYVGGDFKRHSASSIWGAVAKHHTEPGPGVGNAIVPYFYSSLPVDPAADPVTMDFMKAVGVVFGEDKKPLWDQSVGHRWRDITLVNDGDANAMIRKDKIDILVDLSGHTGGNRLSLFTWKPAPIQATAWGFAHGTGLLEIDYFMADPVVVPEHERQHYVEEVVDLPCVVTLDPPNYYNLRGWSHPPCRNNGYVKFGCYARYEKLSDDYLKLVARILWDTGPDSKVEFKDGAFARPHAVRRVLRIFNEVWGRGPGTFPEDRALFLLGSVHPDHMACYQQADIILDPFPHSGGAAALEELWMGVPIVTLYGPNAGGRTTSSLLTLMGRTDWIARTQEEYAQIAYRLAEKPGALFKARRSLRQELLDSPAVKGYVQAVEEKYRWMWECYCRRQEQQARRPALAAV